MRIKSRLVAAVLAAGLLAAGAAATAAEPSTSVSAQQIALVASHNTYVKWHWWGAEIYFGERDTALLMAGGTIAVSAIPGLGPLATLMNAGLTAGGIITAADDKCALMTVTWLNPKHPKTTTVACTNTGTVAKPS